MIGYKVTATGEGVAYTRIYSGWSEGDPTVSSKMAWVAKFAGKVMINVAKGGPIATVADIVSMPLQGMGKAAGEIIAENLKKINLRRGDQGLQVYDIDVTLTGAFRARYRLKTFKDLQKLPALLAVLRQPGKRDGYMGASVQETVFWANVNFARYLYQIGGWSGRSMGTKTKKLTLKIEL